jgi:hypothetical protein
MNEHWRNFPLKVTCEAAIGYALYYGLFGPSPMSWGLVIGGGAVMLCIIAAIEVRIVRRRQRNSNGQTVKPPAPNPDGTS